MNPQSSFKIFELNGPGHQEWLNLFESWPAREVFAHPGYLALFHRVGDRPLCAVYSCPDGRVIYPIIVRDLRSNAFWGLNGEELYDIISPPYGYGGPFIEGIGDKSDLAERFFKEYKQWAQSQKIVSEYAIFSPKEDKELPYPGKVTVKMPVILRTLDPTPEDIFRDYKKTLQRHVRGAQRAKVSVEIDRLGTHTQQFLKIYQETMIRKNAESEYYLTEEFLNNLALNLPGYFAFFYAMLEGRVISTELVLISADSTFFFRGGTSEEAFPAKPNHLLKHHIILWSRLQGKRFYVLGGGHEPQDSLFQYKNSYAPQGVRPLKVGHWIINRKRYDQVTAARKAYEKNRGIDWVPKQGYFPEYRAPSME